MKSSENVKVTGHDLTIEQVVSVARYHTEVEIGEQSLGRLEAMRSGLEYCIKRGDVMYGVNTGCGNRKTIVLPPDELSDYQMRYIPAHCCGYGPLFDEEVVRGAMLIRLNSFQRGNSGLRPLISERLRDFLNLGITPCIPQYGSVGASGDLVPLAHMAAAMIGLPEANVMVREPDGSRTTLPAPEALKRFDLKPIVLQAKEAMGITNGASYIAAIGCLGVYDAQKLLEQACLATALSLEAIRGEIKAFDPRIHEARPLPGQIYVAKLVRAFLEGSKRITEESRAVDLKDEKPVMDGNGRKVPRVQDAYSFRCVPQIFAGAHHALTHVRDILAVEINSSTDNPLLFASADGYEVVSGGNFHGQPLASCLEYLGIAMAPLAGSSDRRLFALLSPASSFGLPADLAGPVSGNTGMMILQYAGAALINKIGHLAVPCSVHSVPTSANQEDWVSMGMNSALNLREMLPLVRWVLAAEMLGAAQGIKLTEEQLPLADYPLGKGTSLAYGQVLAVFADKVGTDTKTWFRDRNLSLDTDAVAEILVGDGLTAKIV